MIRAVALSLMLLCSLAALPTLTNSFASLRNSHAKHYKKRRHSKRWWRQHRAMLRRKRAMRAAQKGKNGKNEGNVKASSPNAKQLNVATSNVPNASSPASINLPVPSSWKQVNAAGGEMRFDVHDEAGRTAGTAVFTRIGVASSATMSRGGSLGGVSLAELRRSVIDRMYAAGGWVTNDAVRQVNGQRIFVVQAASGAAAGNGGSFGAGGNHIASARIAWNYYFVESNGRIYSLATATTPEFAAPLAAESEHLLASLPHTGGGGANATLATR